MPLILNGHEKGYASTEIDLRGKKYTGIKSINWSEEIEKGTADGNGQVSLGPVQGPYKASADFEMLVTEADRFDADLGSPIGATPFNVGVMWVEGTSVSEVQINYATVMKKESSNARGADAAYRKYTLHVWYPIITNGLSLVPLPDQSLVVAPSIALTV